MKSNKITNALKAQFADTKHINRTVLRQYSVIIALWAIIVIAMLILFTVYTYEMTIIYNTEVKLATPIVIDGTAHQVETVQGWRDLLPKIGVGPEQQRVYQAMVETVFGTTKNVGEVGKRIPIVWFSCMLFIPNFSSVTNWQTCWDNKLLHVTTCQIYILISQILALAGMIFHLVLITQYGIKIKISKKRGYSNKYPLYKNDFTLYSNTSYVNFIIAIAVFFSFYALSAAIIMLIYMLIIKAIYKKINEFNQNQKNSINIFNSSDLSYFKTLFIVMAVMIIYNTTNSLITSWLNVDITVVLNGLFSTGGIAVIIFSLVRSLLSSSITDIRRKMKNIDKQIDELRFFYDVREGEAAFDFEYAKKLPPVIKEIIIKSSKVNSYEIGKAFKTLFEYTDFIKNFNFKKNALSSNKRRNFILYRMYNEIKTFDEMEDIKANLLIEFAK